LQPLRRGPLVLDKQLQRFLGLLVVLDRLDKLANRLENLVRVLHQRVEAQQFLVVAQLGISHARRKLPTLLAHLRLAFGAEVAQALLEDPTMIALALRDNPEPAADTVGLALLRPFVERNAGIALGNARPIQEGHHRLALAAVGLAQRAEARSIARHRAVLQRRHLGLERLLADNPGAIGAQKLLELKIPIHGTFLLEAHVGPICSPAATIGRPFCLCQSAYLSRAGHPVSCNRRYVISRRYVFSATSLESPLRHNNRGAITYD